MDLLLILTYTAICVVIFKVFKIPLNKWSVPTAILGGVLLLGTLIFVMNYNHPYSEIARKYMVSTPIVPSVAGHVIEVPVQPNQMLEPGEVLFRLDATPYQAAVDSLSAQLLAAEDDFQRAEKLLKTGAISRRDHELAKAKYEDMKGRLAAAQFDLNETTVTAPTRGYVTQVILRPGMMAANIPLRPVMVFVHAEEDLFVAWFRQNSLLRLQEGDSAEIAFDGIPGRVFSGVVSDVFPLLAAGQLQASGVIQADAQPPGRVPVRIKITDPEFDQYRDRVPGGAFGQAALYSEYAHHVAVMRKILLRMSAWMNYLFPFH